MLGEFDLRCQSPKPCDGIRHQFFSCRKFSFPTFWCTCSFFFTVVSLDVDRKRKTLKKGPFVVLFNGGFNSNQTIDMSRQYRNGRQLIFELFFYLGWSIFWSSGIKWAAFPYSRESVYKLRCMATVWASGSAMVPSGGFVYNSLSCMSPVWVSMCMHWRPKMSFTVDALHHCCGCKKCLCLCYSRWPSIHFSGFSKCLCEGNQSLDSWIPTLLFLC